MKDMAYSAVVSTSILQDENFKDIVEILKQENKWNLGMESQVDSLKEISLSLWKRIKKSSLVENSSK